jgi:hypothetical protein
LWSEFFVFEKPKTHEDEGAQRRSPKRFGISGSAQREADGLLLKTIPDYSGQTHATRAPETNQQFR